MAKKELQIEDDIIDLTELIESGDSGDRRAATAYAKAAKMQAEPDDGFESILAQETGKSAPENDPEDALDMSDMGGIDNLLESLDIPAQPRESASAAKAVEADLDSALDDLLGPEPASAPKEDATDGLDDLLNDLPSGDEPAPPQQAKTGPAADMRDLDADLDDILSSFDEPAPKKPESAPADKAEEITADLDDILNDVAPPPPPEPEIAETPPPPEPEPEIAKAAGQDVITSIDLPDIAPNPAPEEEPFIEPAPAMAEQEDEPAKGPVIAEKDEEAPQIAPASRVEPAHMPALGPDPAPAAVQEAIWTPETVAGLCRNLSGIHDSAAQQALQGFARELGEQSAHVEDFGVQLEQLSKRMMACESRLSAARVKIANLEKSLESTAALDDLLREGTPLHAGFMGLIASAVSSALQNFPMEAPRPDPEVLQRLDSLTVRMAETAERVADLERRLEVSESQTGSQDADDMGKLINGLENTDVRIAALEKRLGELNIEVGEKLEKTAAATAAKVLQEEIARLIQDGNGI